jgi:Cdc6-like AAA superfamily ATPase
LSGIADVIEPTTDFDDLPVSTEARRTLESLALADDTGEAILCYLSGPAGVGKSVAVEALCCRAGIEIITADLAAVHAEELGPVFDLLIREAALRDAAVCLTTVTQDDASDVDIDAIARSLDRYMGPVFLTGSEPWTPKVDFESHRTRAVHLPPPDYTLRRDLWRAQSERLPASVEPDMLAATFRLTAGEIDDALSTADALAADEGLTEELVYQGCRAQSSTQLSALATTVDPHYGWKDIVLPDSAMIHLREVAAHVAHRGTVYTEWGFDDRFSLGNGLTVLFSGPSGTGKTMAAEIIAGEAGLALYKVDLSSIVSKYIGETEKNLSRIFEEAADSDAILLFDEADALFGKRTDVKDSHDRYANIEVNYLLQRVEEHDGTVILTTNLEGNVDDAFRRRIHLHVEFPLPDDAARGRIWEAIFPQATPTGDLDIEFLSGLALTGGNIKNIALTAAFLAAADGDSVEMQHIIKATEREFQKTGKRIDPQEFEMYREFLYE